MLVLLYINSTNISPIMIINRIYVSQNLLSLLLVSFLVGLRIYQHFCNLASCAEMRPGQAKPSQRSNWERRLAQSASRHPTVC